METLETISNRASLKTYLSSREVEQEKIDKVLDAARLAPSGAGHWKGLISRKWGEWSAHYACPLLSFRRAATIPAFSALTPGVFWQDSGWEYLGGNLLTSKTSLFSYANYTPQVEVEQDIIPLE